ncbi:MAG: hypothetical protein WDK96_01360 [Candidatus Paceibacterota bacterium]|jgi:hypothetical protein
MDRIVVKKAPKEWPTLDCAISFFVDDEAECIFVKNGCKRLAIFSLLNLFIHLENSEEDFLETFGQKSLKWIKEIKRKLKELGLNPPEFYEYYRFNFSKN